MASSSELRVKRLVVGGTSPIVDLIAAPKLKLSEDGAAVNKEGSINLALRK